MSTPTKEEILRKHLSVDHALDSGMHFTHDLIYKVMDEWAEIVSKEREKAAYDKAIDDLTKIALHLIKLKYESE
ncbi:MAG TPA: hypothetical protein VK618_09795 [Flavitalea sp.]|nr:hypothetical protein [Flavitalea sp.]